MGQRSGTGHHRPFAGSGEGRGEKGSARKDERRSGGGKGKGEKKWGIEKGGGTNHHKYRQ